MQDRQALDMAVHRMAIGSFGERVAASFMERHGGQIIDRNLRVGRGEIDLIVDFAGRRVAVEVKTAIDDGIGHPSDAFTDAKADQVRSLADTIGIRRVDLVTVAVRSDGVDVVWSPRAA